MKYSKSIIIFSVLVLMTVVACKSKKVAPDAMETKACDEKVTFATLQPLLSKNCTTSGCHDESKKRMNFKIYAQLKNFGEKGEIKEHVLIEKNMPPESKLSGAELRQVRCWIEGGMLEN
ncbi:MAG: hypothetical protein Q7W45_09925 [Bacteroidota bacterium]|nr:hypothetical protein [Bacteroidota bacterium]MDP3143789.1 hypothetical protein [Bacteroidota bacterium]MDP3556957.1 hypothetical protein [Bacteroidota bacterium]